MAKPALRVELLFYLTFLVAFALLVASRHRSLPSRSRPTAAS